MIFYFLLVRDNHGESILYNIYSNLANRNPRLRLELQTFRAFVTNQIFHKIDLNDINCLLNDFNTVDRNGEG